MSTSLEEGFTSTENQMENVHRDVSDQEVNVFCDVDRNTELPYRRFDYRASIKKRN